MLIDAVSKQDIFAKQALWLHRTGPVLFIGHWLSAAGLVWLLWDSPPARHDLLHWFAGMTLVLGLRWIIFLLFRADPRRAQRSLWWLRWFAVGAALSGVAWGYAGWHFFQPSLLFLFPLALVLAAQVALSVPTAGVYFPAHAVFNLLTMTPFLLRNLQEGGRLFLGQSFALFTLMLACLWFAYQQQATIREAIRLRFANLDLLARLRRENERAEQARHQAEATNAAKSRFLAAASHDLRQPLQAMALFSQALFEDSRAGRLPSPALVGNITSSAESLQTLLDSLLDLSRSEVGALKIDIGNMPLQPLLDRIRREFYDQATAQGLRLRVVSTRHHVHSDPAILERILRNLIVNALRYTRQGGILIGCRRRGYRLCIEVRDSGIGIPESAHHDIFQEFYQLDNPERDRNKGLGLGLAIVGALARQIGHRVWVRSAPGRGSVFTIELPLGEAKPMDAIRRSDTPDRLAGRWLAVIDDDAQVRAAMAGLLNRWGCHVIGGENADDIIAAFHADATAKVPVAILTDWRLREGRLGDDEARRLQAHFNRAIPTALISGDTTLSARDIDLPIIHKPVQGFRLRTQLEALLRQADGDTATP